MPPASAFIPPSPGAWELERTHMTRPVSGFLAEAFPRAMMKGFRESTRHYGALLDYFEIVVLHRFVYMAVRPVGAPKSAKGPPPRLLFKLLQVLHPEFRRRNARATDVFRNRVWRDELRRWDEEVKPANLREGAALLREPLASLSDAQLSDHLTRAAEFAERTIYWHHRFNACTVVPMGDFLAHVGDWTGLAPSEVLPIFKGLSPVSAGATEELSALAGAVRQDPEAARALASSLPPQFIIDALLTRPHPVNSTLQAYLDVIGWRVIGAYEVSEPHGLEHPDLLVRIIRAAASDQEVPQQRRARHVADLRARVPEQHRTAFDALLHEAEITYRLRDERHFHGDALGVGVLRRALLEAGRRLTAAGRLRDPDDVMDASIAEVRALLDGGSEPGADDLARRATYRREASISDAPGRLGHPPSPPPPAEWLPPDAARLQRAIGIVISLMFDAHRNDHDTTQAVLKGNAASPGVYEGPARVIINPSELHTVCQGDVLIAPSTAPTFNVVLPLVAAIVTERGGALSHAAIVAREYGIPAVVGCPAATTTIRTGMRIRVEGGTGEVRILET